MRRFFIIAGVLTALVCAVVGGAAVVLLVREESQSDGVAASQRESWESLGIDHYEVKMLRAYRPPDSGCLQHIEVQGGQIVVVHSNQCHPSFQLVTLDNLFPVIEILEQESACGVLGCSCHGFVPQVTYHPTYYYPEILDLARGRSSGFVGSVERLSGSCHTGEIVFDTDTRVIEFEPLP